MKDRLLQTDERHAAWVTEREDQRTRAMLLNISVMFLEALAVTVFLGAFR